MLIACAVPAGPVTAHFFVVVQDRAGAKPAEEGTGWRAEVFLDLPDDAATQLLTAESYIADRQPDFTFRTPYIDFPAGPADSVLETDAPTIGDFLDDYIYEVSDPAKLAEPLTNFVVRFHGLLDVRLQHTTLETYGIPVLLDFATQGYGAYRTRIGSTSIYRIQDTVLAGGPLFTENALLLGLGLFPMEVTYLNRYDPDDSFGHERVGVELYSWHPGGLPWPAGEPLVFPRFGPMTVTPPRVIYQADQVPSPLKGDADQDRRVTLRDFATFQDCYTGPGVYALDETCQAMDFAGDHDVDSEDFVFLNAMLEGPKVYPLLPGDFDADLDVDLADMQWLQVCFSAGGDGPGGLAEGCQVFDVNDDNQVTPADYQYVAKLIAGPIQ